MCKGKRSNAVSSRLAQQTGEPGAALGEGELATEPKPRALRGRPQAPAQSPARANPPAPKHSDPQHQGWRPSSPLFRTNRFRVSSSTDESRSHGKQRSFHEETRGCNTHLPHSDAAFGERHGATGSKPRGEQQKSPAVYKMICEDRGKNQRCSVSRKQLRSHNSLQICNRDRITGLVLQKGRGFFSKHVN